jgi:hypothetical protein
VVLSHPQAGLNRMRLRTTSTAPIVHLKTAPGHPAGVGRSRIEALETEPVGGRAPWAQIWGAPALTPGGDLDWPRLPANIHNKRGEILPYQWAKKPMRPLAPPPGVLTALGDRESGAYTEPTAPPARAAAAADELTRPAQRARFATETRRGRTPRFEPFPRPGATAFWSDQRKVSGMTNEDLWDYGVRYAGKPDGGY